MIVADYLSVPNVILKEKKAVFIKRIMIDAYLVIEAVGVPFIKHALPEENRWSFGRVWLQKLRMSKSIDTEQ